MSKSVLFLDTVHPILEQRLAENGFDCIHDYQSSANKVLENNPGIQGLVIRSRFPLDAEFLAKADGLEFIARAGAGLENIDTAYCLKKGIQVFAAPEGNRDAVAEHAIAMILSLLNRLPIVAKEIQEGVWKRAENRGRELMSKTIGIYGYGNTGAALAKRLKGFGMTILAYDKYKSNFGSADIIEVDLKTLMAESDIISLHLPESKETVGLVDQKFISACAKPFYLINTARGNIVDTEDLIVGLESGKVLGACLDVFDFEKSSFTGLEKSKSLSSLLKMEQVILSPHIAGWTHESHERLSNVLADKILRHYKLGI